MLGCLETCAVSDYKDLKLGSSVTGTLTGMRYAASTIRLLGESFAFAPRNESLASKERMRLKLHELGIFASFTRKMQAGMQRTDAASKDEMLKER